MGAQYTHFSCFPRGQPEKAKGQGSVTFGPYRGQPLPSPYERSHQESSESWDPGAPLLAGNPEGGLVPASEP